jgi:hypothetical protein
MKSFGNFKFLVGKMVHIPKWEFRDVTKPQWVRYKLEEAIKMPCSDLLAIHHRKCMHGGMEIF